MWVRILTEKCIRCIKCFVILTLNMWCVYLNCIISSYKLVPQWMLTKSQNIHEIPLMGVHFLFYIIQNKNIDKSLTQIKHWKKKENTCFNNIFFSENVNVYILSFLSKSFVHANLLIYVLNLNLMSNWCRREMENETLNIIMILMRERELPPPFIFNPLSQF